MRLELVRRSVGMTFVKVSVVASVLLEGKNFLKKENYWVSGFSLVVLLSVFLSLSRVLEDLWRNLEVQGNRLKIVKYIKYTFFIFSISYSTQITELQNMSLAINVL